MQLKAVLGMSDMLNKTGEIVKMTIEIVSENEWLITELDNKINPNPLDTKSIINSEIIIAAGEHGIRYIPEINAVVSLWLATLQNERLYSEYTKQVILDQLTGMCYARSGMLTKALSLWEKPTCHLSSGQFIQRILAEQLRKNLLAEAMCGNECHGKEGSILGNCHFWGLAAGDPRLIYKEGNFYIHPAGLNHQNREAALANMLIGQQVIFEMEPQNIHDPQAVHLWTEFGGDLGYVPRRIAATIAFNMRRGTVYQAKIAGIRASAFAYRRLAIWVESVN